MSKGDDVEEATLDLIAVVRARLIRNEQSVAQTGGKVRDGYHAAATEDRNILARFEELLRARRDGSRLSTGKEKSE